MIVNPSLLRMGYLAARKAWDSGTIEPPPYRSQILSLAYAAAVAIDCSQANDYAISGLTGDLALTWINAQLGNYGTLTVRQDAIGGRLVSLTAPAGFTLMRDSAVADLAAAAGAQAFTIYTWQFTGVAPTAIMLASKVLPV